jgi:hypothetical protein
MQPECTSLYISVLPGISCRPHAVRFLFPTCHNAGPYHAADRYVTSLGPDAKALRALRLSFAVLPSFHLFTGCKILSHQNRAMPPTHVKDVSKVRKSVSHPKQVKK